MMKRLFLFGFLLAFVVPPSSATGAHKSFQEYNFSKGLDTYHNPYSLAQGYIQNGQNILFDDTAPIAKRKGYTVAWSTKSYSYTGLWSYTDASNTTWQIARSSDQLTASNLTGTIVLIATVSVNNLVGETVAFGNAYFVDQTQGVYYWNGSSTTFISGSPLGSIITTFHGRIWVTGAAVPSGNQLYGSGYYSPTNWTSGLNATDPVQYSVGLQDNFDNVTAAYVYIDTLYLFKHYSIYALYGFDQTSFQISQLTQECGCIDGNTIQTYNSALEFVSLRGIESFNGYSCTRISDSVKNKVDPAIQVGGFSQQSWAQSTTTDWASGSFSPPSSLSLTAAAPGLALSTMSATSFSDASQANFAASSSIVNLDTTTNPGSMQLLSTTPTTQQSGSYQGGNPGGFEDTYCTNYTNGTSCVGQANNVAQSFVTSNQYQQMAGVQIYLGGSSSSATTLRLKNDSGGTPGSDITTVPISGGLTVGGSMMTYTFASPVELSPSTKYWIWLDGTSGSAGVCAGLTSPYDSYAPGGTYYNIPTCSMSGSSAYDITFVAPVSGVYYPPTGSSTSRTFDTTVSTPSWVWSWGNFNTTETDNGGTILYGTESSADGSTWETELTGTPGSPVRSSPQRYVRYLTLFNSPSAFSTPVLSSVTINTFSFERSSGTFRSQSHAIGGINNFGNFSVLDSLNGGSITFSVCSANNSSMTGAACSVQSPNTQITIATNSYVNFYATFTVTSATSTPTLSGTAFQWYTGTRSVPMASTVWDNRYWLSLTTTTTDSVNDSVLVLNHTGAWTIFDIHAGAFTQYKNSLYHADSLGSGNIYLDNQGQGDNGKAINAFIRTRELTLGDYAADDYLYDVYPSASNTGICPMTVGYNLDFNPGMYSLGTPLLSEFGNMSAVRLPFPVDTSHQDFGQALDFTVGTDDNQCDWQFYGLEGLFKMRPTQ